MPWPRSCLKVLESCCMKAKLVCGRGECSADTQSWGPLGCAEFEEAAGAPLEDEEKCGQLWLDPRLAMRVARISVPPLVAHDAPIPFSTVCARS